MQQSSRNVSKAGHAFYLWHVAVPLVVFALLILAIQFTDLDRRAAELFYDASIGVFPLRDDWLLQTVEHVGAKRAVILLASVATLHFLLKRIPPAILFWAAYVLTRPLGATLGDVLTKSRLEGGLAQGRILSTLIIGGLMIVAIILASRRERAAEN